MTLRWAFPSGLGPIASDCVPDRLLQDHGTFALRTSADVRCLRNRIRNLATYYGFSQHQIGDILLSFGETIANAVRHGRGGTVTITTDPVRRCLQIRVVNQGDVARFPSLGEIGRYFETVSELGATKGYGLPMILQTADRVWVYMDGEEIAMILEHDLCSSRFRSLRWDNDS